ncbi:hypothetical protein [Gimesia chilikensis]|uniref:Uncharacterized protein n=1 Tax=Gimesia chilikensis TaxID=2605989 RepID=A0A517PT49_9PLAN|nr:hypothetical protein [Gimesia chilikensis]QDT22556.1 hypothetical protein HG66A1_43640 [Gimesia chilikensis]
MKITIGGKSIGHETVTYRELGFGQNMSDTTIPYQLRLSCAEFQCVIRNLFNEFVVENQQDDNETDESEAIPELVQNGYPTFDALLSSSRRDLCNVIKDYLFFELLHGLLGSSNTTECKFAINSLESLTCSDDGFVITGKAYSIN